MTNIKNISVFAIGNPNSTNGVCPLVFYNNPQFDLANSSEKGFQGNLYYFTVKIAKNYTVYQLTKNNVKSNNGNRGGFFALAFSIPKGYELVGTNPYRVLMDLWKEFRSKCMNLLDKNTDSYEFNSLDTDRQVLDSLAGSYVLTPVDKPHREMNPSGPVGLVVAEENKIEELLSDVQYTEFAQFQKVVIAETCDDPSSYILPRIQIPRPSIYSLYVDGILQPKKYTNVLEEIIVCSGKNDDPCYNHVTKTFTIKGLLNGDVIDGITIDKSAENIFVNTASWKTPKERKISIKILPREFENQIFLNSAILQVKSYDGRLIRLDKNLSFKLTGTEISLLAGITVSLSENKTYELVSCILKDNDINVTLRKKTQIASQQGGYNSNVSVPTVTNPQSNVVDVKLQFSSDFFSKVSANNELYVKIRRKSDERKQMLFSSVVIFKKEKNNILEGHIYVPKEIVSSQHISEFYFEDKKTTYSLNKRIDANRNNNVFTDNDFSKQKKSPLMLHAKEIVLSLILLVSLFSGGLGGYFLYEVINKESKGEPKEQHTEEPKDNTADELKDFLKETNAALNSEGLTFKMIAKIYEEYSGYTNDTIKKQVLVRLCNDDSGVKNVIDTLMAYNDVVSTLTTKDWINVKGITKKEYYQLIRPNHRVQVDTVVMNKATFENFRNEWKINNDKIQFKHLASYFKNPNSGSGAKMSKCDFCGNEFKDLVQHKNLKGHWKCTKGCKINEDRDPLGFSTEEQLSDHYQTKHKNETTNTNVTDYE